MISRLLAGAASIALLASLSGGCIAVGGSHRHEAVSLGRQLQDLKAARDCGALTDEEYACAKAGLLATANRPRR